MKYNEGLEKGLEEGEKIGIEKGEKNAKIETAKRMLKRGLSIEDVADFSGLSTEDVSNLVH